MSNHLHEMASVSQIRKVGRYEVIREIGRGGTAVVYLARQTDLDRGVALKELAAFRASDPAFVERFLRESRLTGGLNHPNIVTVHEYFEYEGTPFIAMEYFERGSLRPHVGHLDPAQIAGVLEGLLAGLAHAETRGVVHRDLKPENVMVTSPGGVKIADFGMAKARELHAAEELTASGTTVGTPAYMAPEQALGSVVTPRTDLYSIGVIAYELLAGRVPFDQAEAPMAIMLRHLNEDVPPLLGLADDVDPQLAAWVERLLAKRPEDRPAGAAEAWDELEELVIGTEGPRWHRRARIADAASAAPAAAAAGTAGTLRVTRRLPVERRSVWAALTAVGALGAAGIAAAFFLAGGSPSGARTSEQTTTRERGGETIVSRHVVKGPVLARIMLQGTGDPVLISLRSSGRLHAGAIHVPDSDLSDGHAMIRIRQKGIRSTTPGGTFGPATVLVRKGAGFLRIDVAAEAGSFTTLTARAVDEHRIRLQLERAAAPPTVGTAPPSGGASTTTTTTGPSQPSRKKKNQLAIDTG
jgi:predicted Ser/Thr protein kinase